jgi:hypothetical protein
MSHFCNTLFSYVYPGRCRRRIASLDQLKRSRKWLRRKRSATDRWMAAQLGSKNANKRSRVWVARLKAMVDKFRLFILTAEFALCPWQEDSRPDGIQFSSIWQIQLRKYINTVGSIWQPWLLTRCVIIVRVLVIFWKVINNPMVAAASAATKCPTQFWVRRPSLVCVNIR